MSQPSLAEVLVTDRALERLVEPLLVTPEQFVGNSARRLQEGERRLMAAVLEDAIVTLARYAEAEDEEGRAIHRETLEWLECPSGPGLFSFSSVCDYLGIDADNLREGLRRWRRSHLAASRSAAAARASGAEDPHLGARRRPIDKTAIRTGALRVPPRAAHA